MSEQRAAKTFDYAEYRCKHCKAPITLSSEGSGTWIAKGAEKWRIACPDRPSGTGLNLHEPDSGFMGLIVPVRMDNLFFSLRFPQELTGMEGERRAYKLYCEGCQQAAVTPKRVWQSSTFLSGDDEEAKHSYEEMLADVAAHLDWHERISAWYGMLEGTPAYLKGFSAGVRSTQESPKP